ncbi:AMP-binding protein [Nocardioides seonyuensis]|uniref:AMP-binding protein n=1 Tax=Nocardioides seonyuensis TaxID=2518371 RepID=UPI001ABE0709|nr:AMP-binding protein [Nocardioides seonyuensis]
MNVATAIERYGADQVAAFYEQGVWRDASLITLLETRAATAPDRMLVRDDTGALSGAELLTQARSLAAGLERLGVEAGDRVAVQLPNWREFFVIVAAASYLGAITVPVMPIYRREDVGHLLRDAGVKVAFTPAEFRGFDHAAMYDELLDSVDSLQSVVLVRSASSTASAHTRLEDLLAAPSDDFAPSPASPDDPWVIVYSSGTTSRPKGCVHSFNTIGSGARLLAEALAYRDGDVTFGPAPVTHTQGLVNAFLIPLISGGSARILEAWSAGTAREAIDRDRCTVVMTPPAMLRMLLDDGSTRGGDLPSVRLWILAGAAIPPDLMRQAGEVLPHVRLLSLYGRTENLTTTMCVPEDPPQLSVDTDGRALPGMSVRIVGDDGKELPLGEEGDVAFRGPTHMLGYLGLEEETDALFTPDGYSMSGDLGVMDENGYVRVTGRTKDIVIRGGMNISVRQIEDLLVAHPAVANAAVVGMPDSRLGEIVCAFVILRPGASLTLQEVRDHLLGEGLPIQKVPEHLEVVSAMPLTALGKVQKAELWARARELASSTE